MHKVGWEIDIDGADSAIEAAVQAYFHVQRRGTSANVFQVTDEAGQTRTVDIQTLRDLEDPYVENLLYEQDEKEIVHYVLQLLSSGEPVVHGPFENVDARNDAVRQLAVTIEDRGGALYSVHLSPLNLEMLRINPSELDD